MNLKPFLKLFPVIFLFFGLAVGVFLIGKEVFFFGRAAFGKPANLVIDVGSSFDVQEESWKNLAQGGEESGRMLLPVLEKTRALSPHYIRIDHIYDFYDVVKRDGAGNVIYDWSKLDLTLGDILAIGAKPFISLSYTPPVLTSGDIVSIPNSWTEWENLVQATVEHISGQAGLNISGVYYEVWNEPDLFGKFKVYGEKNYLDLYLHSATGASRAKNINPFKLGGPATTALYENWFRSLLKFAQQKNLKLDFFSWHKYSKNLEDYSNDSLKIKKWLNDFPAYSDIELVISELGPNSENDKVYDGSFSGVHLLATTAVFDGEINKVFNFEIKDGPGPEKFWGRWGIMTHEKFGVPEVKPRYNALAFLNRMAGDKVNVAGEGSWVKALAREKGGIFRTMIVNYDPDFRHSEIVPVTFTNLQSQNFTLKKIKFGGGVETINVATTSATWATTELLKANSAVIFEIVPN